MRAGVDTKLPSGIGWDYYQLPRSLIPDSERAIQLVQRRPTQFVPLIGNSVHMVSRWQASQPAKRGPGRFPGPRGGINEFDDISPLYQTCHAKADNLSCNNPQDWKSQNGQGLPGSRLSYLRRHFFTPLLWSSKPRLGIIPTCGNCRGGTCCLCLEPLFARLAVIDGHITDMFGGAV